MATGGLLLIKKKVALAIIYEDREKILLQLRDFKEWISHPGEWALFGGSIKHKEWPAAAIVRELQEELGFSSHSPTYFKDYYYEEESAFIYVYSYAIDFASERLHLKEGQEFGIFSIDKILKGRLYSKKLQSDYPVTPLATKIISGFFYK